MELSQRAQAIKPSPSMQTAAKAAALRAQGRDIIGLSAGEPDFPTPEHIQQAAIRAMKAGQTKYTLVDGTIDVRQAVVDKFQRENHLRYQLHEVIVSSGAKHSIFNVMAAILNPGDEVIIPAPYWVSYPDVAKIFGAVPVEVVGDKSHALKITPEKLAAKITPKTKLLMLNSPSNPSGAVYSKKELQDLATVLLQHPQVFIISDDIYEHILWTDEPFCNIVNACPELKERTAVINGASKAYAMTGWRIGYTGAPEYIVKAMKKIQSQSTSAPCSISQAATVAALNGPQDCLSEMLVAFKTRHDHVVKRLNEIPGFECAPASGAFYAFPHIEGAMQALGLPSDVAFAEHLLDQAEVAIVPGSAYGTPGYLRLSYATNIDTLDKALDRISKALR